MNEIISLPIPTIHNQVARQIEMIDLGIVFKARTVIETIEAFLVSRGIGQDVKVAALPEKGSSA